MSDDELIAAYRDTLRGLSLKIAKYWTRRDRLEVAKDIEQAGWELIFKRYRAGKHFSWMAVVSAMRDEGCRSVYGVTRRAIKLSPRQRPVRFDDLDIEKLAA